ncbi:MAG: hypothetical protein [Microviridae sp.]|nr:MAG: hypothetical protein [Microviridae sp.]
MDPLMGGLISGGLSLLSGFGAQSAAKKQAKKQAAADMLAQMENARLTAEKNAKNEALGREMLATPRTKDVMERNYSWVDTDAMMKAAEASGFNPATWLNAGGMQAYTQTQHEGHEIEYGAFADKAFALMSPESALVTASQAQNIPSTMSVFGNAASSAFGEYQKLDAQQQSQEFQKELLGIQLNAIRQNRAGSTTQTVNQGTPSYSTSGGTTTRGGAASQSAALSGLGYPNSWFNPTPYDATLKKGGVNDPGQAFETDKVKVMNPFVRVGVKVDPDLPGAESVEDTYGDLAGSVYGFVKFPNDLVYTLSGKGIPRWMNAGYHYLNRGIDKMPWPSPPVGIGPIFGGT